MTKLDQLERESSNLLFRCHSVFPFSLFPTTIEVTATRVDVKYGVFFGSHEYVSILIDDLVNVVVSTNLFFGTARFEIKNFEKNPPVILYLWKEDAVKLKQVVTGMIESRNAKIDTSRLNTAQKEMIQRIGASQNEPVVAV